jgi:hypothetical protein
MVLLLKRDLHKYCRKMVKDYCQLQRSPAVRRWLLWWKILGLDQRQGEDNLELVICSTEEVKVGGYTTEAFLVGKQVESFFWESAGGRMEIGSTSKGVVGEEGVQYEFSLDMLNYLLEDLLLQYEEEDIKGELERCEPLVLTPLAVNGGQASS